MPDLTMIHVIVTFSRRLACREAVPAPGAAGSEHSVNLTAQHPRKLVDFHASKSALDLGQRERAPRSTSRLVSRVEDLAPSRARLGRTTWI
jgi:hypothetical protein